MPTNEGTVTFQKKELKGSRLRCLMLTSLPRRQIAQCLTELVQPYGVVDSGRDRWMPRGFLEPAETKLGEAELFLGREDRELLTDWWLAVKPHANTPNWDVVSTCRIDGKDGLILVEAKAYRSELSTAGKKEPTTEHGWKNHVRIEAAIKDANVGISTLGSGWALSHNKHYQLCNRFAWSWKLASMSIPVVLVYLGFLNVDEMTRPFLSAGAWRDAVLEHSSGVVPSGAWGTRVMVGNTPIYPIIRSLDLQYVPFGDIAGGKQ